MRKIVGLIKYKIAAFKFFFSTPDFLQPTKNTSSQVAQPLPSPPPRPQPSLPLKKGG
jgi:hypothetical protein